MFVPIESVLIVRMTGMKPALPSLIAILRCRDTGKERATGKALDRIMFRTHDLDQVRRMQLRAIEIVRNLGPTAAEARPHLERQRCCASGH